MPLAKNEKARLSLQLISRLLRRTASRDVFVRFLFVFCLVLRLSSLHGCLMLSQMNLLFCVTSKRQVVKMLTVSKCRSSVLPVRTRAHTHTQVSKRTNDIVWYFTICV